MSAEDRFEKYRQDVRRTFQSMSLDALHFQNARIPWNDCIDRQEIDREYDRRDIAARLEYLRGEIRAERISYGEIAEACLRSCDVAVAQAERTRETLRGILEGSE